MDYFPVDIDGDARDRLCLRCLEVGVIMIQLVEMAVHVRDDFPGHRMGMSIGMGMGMSG